MQYLNNKNALFDLLIQGATVITPNNRLSAALLQQYFKYCANTTVTKPSCLPYGSVLTRAYQQLKFANPEHNHPTLLNSIQCQHLWRNIIKADATVTYSEGLLQAVMEAWTHCQQWQINCEDQSFYYTPQTQQFQTWWQHFNEKTQQLGLVTEHQLIPYLLNSGCTLFNQPLIWVCFDDFNPQQLSLQQHLSNNELPQYCYDLKEQQAMPRVLAASDNKEEYQQLIAWLQLKIQQGEQHIGIVIPDLQQQSRSLQRMLLHHFDPALFNISLGQALSEFPLIAHALAWLNLDHQQLSLHQIALLLQSPYIGCAKEEFLARSQYLQDSTLLQDQSVSLQSLINDLVPSAPKLAALLRAIKPYPKKASPQEWVKIIQERLNAIGFPGDYALNSENYQCFNRFTAIFDELRQLSIISPQLDANEALDALVHLNNNTIFQAQKTNASIQISGLLEASGCEFDSLWVMGLTNQCLPQKTRLSAFIPPQLQRELLMPHSIPARELHFARQTLQRLQRGSIDTVFSYAKLQGDNPHLPCSLIADFPVFTQQVVTTASIKQSDLIALEENYKIPLKAEEQFSGGTALLANQAKCPFKAFAEHRLRAKPLPQTSDGLNNLEKGQIIHKIMELLWQALKSQQQLLHLSQNALDKQVDEAIKTALTPLYQLHPHSFPSLIQEVECTRLKRLVLSYLEWEKQRAPFEIFALEQSYSINLAGLDFQVRVDRLDTVDAKKWVIDYKSTIPASKPWNEERPTEPQLLLYALLDEQINTLLLLQLKSGKIVCSGLSAETQAISGISTLKKEELWNNVRNKWQQQLTLLAEEFQQGHCPPQPANPIVCQHCEFQNLCRI
ncbi:MAG: PD-(D/E)XK nuclease family protein [Legionellales bacterium]